jgi:hypothetical protein
MMIPELQPDRLPADALYKCTKQSILALISAARILQNAKTIA